MNNRIKLGSERCWALSPRAGFALIATISVMVLLAPSEQETYRAYLINGDPTKLPFGKVRIHNYCKHPIAMRFSNSQPDIIRPFKTRKVTPRNK